MADERDDSRVEHQQPDRQQAGQGDTAPLAPDVSRQDDRRAFHVERVARLIARRLRSPGGELFTLLDADRLNDATGWTYRYVTPSGNVVRAQGVSLPSDALHEAWKLAERLAREGVAASGPRAGPGPTPRWGTRASACYIPPRC